MTLYDGLLFLHIVAAAVWVGGSATLQLLGARAQAMGGNAPLASFVAESEFLGRRLLAPAAGTLLLAGVGLVLTGSWSLSQLWIAFGLVVVVASLLMGALYQGPEARRIAHLTQERGIDDTEVRARLRRALLVARVQLLLLVLVVADMVIKPGL